MVTQWPVEAVLGVQLRNYANFIEIAIGNRFNIALSRLLHSDCTLSFVLLPKIVTCELS
jgi:hypothetical protein